MNSALAAMLGLTLSIILIVKKVSPVYSLIFRCVNRWITVGMGITKYCYRDDIRNNGDFARHYTYISSGVLTGMLGKTGAAPPYQKLYIKNLDRSEFI